VAEFAHDYALLDEPDFLSKYFPALDVNAWVKTVPAWQDAG
jgi:hypothetical protein